jgi:outer membrane protein W
MIFKLMLFLLSWFCSTWTYGAEFYNELKSTVNYNSSTGQVDSGDKKTKIDQNEIIATLTYGYFASDNVEPFLELTYRTASDKVGDISTSDSLLDWGVGMLFNIPMGPGETEDSQSKRKKRKRGPVNDVATLANSIWIPYVGIMLASQTSGTKSTSNLGDESDLSHSDVVTKLIMGTRYMIYPNVGFNFALRLFYQNTASEAKAPNSQKGATQKLTIQADLVSLSLLF